MMVFTSDSEEENEDDPIDIRNLVNTIGAGSSGKYLPQLPQMVPPLDGVFSDNSSIFDFEPVLKKPKNDQREPQVKEATQDDHNPLKKKCTADQSEPPKKKAKEKLSESLKIKATGDDREVRPDTTVDVSVLDTTVDVSVLDATVDVFV